MKAMVLAAGKATRLRPLTDAIAKPALPFFGRSILDRVLDGLASAGVTEAIVNLHHAPATVRDTMRATMRDTTATVTLITFGIGTQVWERFGSAPGTGIPSSLILR